MKKRKYKSRLDKISKKLKYVPKSEVNNIIAHHHELEHLHSPGELVTTEITIDDNDEEFKKIWQKIEKDAKTLKVSTDAIVGRALIKYLKEKKFIK